MEWIVILVILVIVVLVVRSVNQRQLREQDRVHHQFEQITAVKQATEEDITALGLELQKLDSEVAGVELDEGARADYQRALDAYEAAKESLGRGDGSTEDPHVTMILDEGRYAIACVRARVAGEPLPARRPPCFFNPQHGPSVRDVSWAPDGGSPREVPACALDAERVEAGADPDSRKVMVGHAADAVLAGRAGVRAVDGGLLRCLRHAQRIVHRHDDGRHPVGGPLRHRRRRLGVVRQRVRRLRRL